MTKMTERRYDTAADVRMRLHGSIVTYKGDPYWVKQTSKETLTVDLVDLRTEDTVHESVDSSDPLLDISSVPLGYTITNKTSAYVYRVPYRQQKQGVSPENTMSILSQAGGNVIGQRGLPVAGTRLWNLIKGVYPTMDQFKKFLSISSLGFPLSRDYCIVRDQIIPGEPLNTVFYIQIQGNNVGFFDPTMNKAFLLPPCHSVHHQYALSKFGIKSEVIGHVDEVPV